ncbi:transcriptional regulator [Leptospira stimsonii]|uniref:Transcriptional regulator n=2 Tax=Leptospira stimsonii TaxID=2202203 RepID=A0A4R9L811_9LEPT|nr:transcriptional regulator [Leptospira stimsonii]TGK18572.1 transcriptional regulator [Leptospira stimsonii]TGM21975.1 transcriptional regulator [Leptospira stimsonii]
MKKVERSYGLNCPVAKTLDLIGERWTIMILRDFFTVSDVRRFIDFEKALDGITPALLSDRLKKLEKYGFITKSLYSESPPRMEYKLTAKGKSLGPILKALRAWGNANT